MFRKQGIDISSRGSFELPARLRIIVRALSRNDAPLLPAPFSLPILLLPSSPPFYPFDPPPSSVCDSSRTFLVHILFPPTPCLPYRTILAPLLAIFKLPMTTGQFIRRNLCFISSTVRNASGSLRPANGRLFSSRAFRAIAPAADPFNFYEPPCLHPCLLPFSIQRDGLDVTISYFNFKKNLV